MASKMLEQNPGGGYYDADEASNSQQSDFVLMHHTKKCKRVYAIPQLKLVIKEVLKKDNRKAAVQLRLLLNEYSVLNNISHPNILKLITFHEDDIRAQIRLPQMDGADLCQRLELYPNKMMGEADAKIVIKQVLSAICYIHSLRIIHRDIKPENILFRSLYTLDVVVCDFDLAASVSHDIDITQDVGTDAFFAAEVYYKMSYSFPVDCYAIGVMLYEMLLAETPIGHYKQQDYDYFDYPLWNYLLTTKCKDLLLSLLTLDSFRRISSVQAIQHPWINDP